MRSEPQPLSIRVPRGIPVPTADGTFRCQSPVGQHLIMDPAAKLVRGCTVAVLFGGWPDRKKARSVAASGDRVPGRFWQQRRHEDMGAEGQGRPDLARHRCPNRRSLTPLKEEGGAE
jgi:hypothetical protein